ncbi:dipeptidase PepE [Streptomyces sp. CRN 30]|uniref:dipeptidase PepE n=1 Tax=Streptomyces sp. CRN 30 TaxID=3075613 RepID=UPI002A7F29A0|nr:dipeptidase PepE [Streptomyces sp. CRN 30]
MNLLLLSNSTAPGRRYLDHALDEIRDVLGAARELLFVPYAGADHDRYTAQVAAALKPLGVGVTGVHTAADPARAVREADAVFTGGGNSFRLLKALHAHGLVTAVRERVAAGAPYLGSSAGTNMACPTLRTTNDMPIVQPPSFESFGLLPFQINPHYQDAPADRTHMGETRAERLTEFLQENDVPVVALREGTWLRRDGDRLALGGTEAGGVLFRRGAEPRELSTGHDLSALLTEPVRFDHR